MTLKIKDLSPVYYLMFAALVFCGQNTAAQTDSTDIDAEKLIIVKPYSPTVSDAFKVNQQPVLEDSTLLKKKEVNYDIFSFPVASTFTPTKGRASGIQRRSLPSTYQNYASLGAGNYGNVDAEFFGSVNLSNSEELSLKLLHNSSQGGIDEVNLDDNFYNTEFGVNYRAQQSNFSWTANVSAEHQLYHWYGLPESVIKPGGMFTQNAYDEFTNRIDSRHSYYAVSAGAGIDMQNGILDDADLQYTRFGDNASSGENHVVLKPHFQFSAGRELIDATLSMNFVNGSFGDYYLNNEYKLDYSFFNVGFNPSIKINRDKLAFKFGAKFVYSIDGEYDDNSVYVYPDVTASYRLAGDYFTLYGGATGDLEQNTYYDLAHENQFLSPTLYITPTDQQYKVYFGGKGKFTEKLGYDLKVSYASENNKALFAHNRSGTVYGKLEDYEHFNSFLVLYDDINTLGLSGELNYQATEKLALRLNAKAMSYDTENQDEAWNLPNWEASVYADFQISDKWMAGASIFAKGERKDFSNFAFDQSQTTEAETVSLDAFVDANLRVGYKLNSRLSFFVRGNNLIGENYERWYGYPVQGIQVMGGASYQFDW